MTRTPIAGLLRLSAPLLVAMVLAACGGQDVPDDGTVAEDPRSGPSAAESSSRDRDAPLPEDAQTRSLLGDVLFPPPMDAELREERQANLDEALENRDREPGNPEHWIWVGRHQAYLGEYRDAIETFTEGLERFPDDARFLRHRGHRHLTLRDFEAAREDLARGIEMAGDAMGRTEPDGLPNALGIPLTTLGFNLWYHRALAEYLAGDFEQALDSWQAALEVSDNPDLQVASRYWLYLTARRTGDDDLADRALDGVDASTEVIENGSYRDLLLLFRGDRTAAELLGESDEGLGTVTLLYGIGMHHQLGGEEDEAVARFQQILERADQWPAFGYIAAEAELARRTPGAERPR